MMLKRNSSPRSAWSLVRAGLAGLAVMVGGAAVTGGCLDRPVAPAVPRTSNVYVDEIRQNSVDKIDLLFMIDNSISMADKQAILAEAVPLLVRRLITPVCVRPCVAADNCTEAEKSGGKVVDGNAPNCPAGSAPEFNPIQDIHVGVVTSSLGSHGATGSAFCLTPSDDDHAHLLGELGPNAIRKNNTPPLQPYDANGFLKWDTTNPAKYDPAGDKDGATFEKKFTDMVKSSGEGGCGFEASLEAWYRFLIDPEPATSIVVDASSQQSAPMGLDQTLLDQRKAFLRPDSLVAIIMLSDENDCSIVDQGYGWFVTRQASSGRVPNMFRATSKCEENPNDNCCQSCAETAARAGCAPLADDPACKKGQTLTADEDAPNLRCWQQKRRFGFELLYPTTRYSGGLREKFVPNRAGQLVANPLYVAPAGQTPRDSGLVFLAGIVGVPWQDIADAETLGTADTLRYMTAAELDGAGRWDVILGDPSASPPMAPTDPLMRESPDPRTGVNPVINAPLASADSMNPRENPINGHEQKNVGNSDLQYACTFQLTTPVPCTAERQMANGGCDCFEGDLSYNRPLCQPPGGGAPTTTQTFAKAYPGTRHLQVLREYKDNSVVASICPKVIDSNKPDYGYNPAVKAIIDRLKDALKGKCLPRPLVPDSAGQVPCAVIEAVPPAAAGCNCDTNNRKPVTDRPELREAVLNKLASSQTCGGDGQTPCDQYCTCEIAQFTGDDLRACQTQINEPATSGYCYVDEDSSTESAAILEDCAADSKRLLRFGTGSPQKGAVALIACLGASLGSQ